MNYRNAKEVRAAARDLMAEHHAHLLGLRVECLFTDKTAKSKGREIPGRVKKVSGFSAYLTLAAGGFPDFYTEEPLDLFVIEVSEEVWEGMKERQRVALVDHLLSQCEIETEEKG